MFSGIRVGLQDWIDPTDPTDSIDDPIGVCNPTPIRLFFDMWDRRIIRFYDPDPDFNNLVYIADTIADIQYGPKKTEWKLVWKMDMHQGNLGGQSLEYIRNESHQICYLSKGQIDAFSSLKISMSVNCLWKLPS